MNPHLIKYLKHLTASKYFPVLTDMEIRLYLLLLANTSEDNEGTINLECMEMIDKKMPSMSEIKSMMASLNRYGLAEFIEFPDDKDAHMVRYRIKPPGLTYIPDRRKEKRVHYSGHCRIVTGRTTTYGKMQDISRNGAKIRYVGKPLTPDTKINIQMMGLNLNKDARVVWSKAVNVKESIAGLNLSEPMPMLPEL